METADKKIKRRWWMRLAAAVVAIANPVLGAVLYAAIEYLTYAKVSLVLGGATPTETQINKAINILENKIIPVINKITDKITALKETNSQLDNINSLNNSLEKIAILQAYVKIAKSSKLLIVNYMVGFTIESLLAKMNSVVTDAINRTKLQKNVELQSVTITASNYSKVGTFELVWFNQTVNQKYQKLVFVQNSTIETVITPSSDNPAVSELVENITPINTDNPTLPTLPTEPIATTEKKGISKLVLALGGFLLYKIFTKKEEPKGLNGSKVCNNRVKCKGINKTTGKTKTGYYYNKKRKVVKKHEGINSKGKLREGWKYAKGGRIIKVKKKAGLNGAELLTELPIEVTIN